MKIKGVTTHNYKSISQDCTLDVDPKITPLVGASETGKTNILEALSKFFASEPFGDSDVCTFSEEPITDDSQMVSVTFRLEDSDREPLSRIDERLAGLNEFTLRKQKNGHYVLVELGPKKISPKPQPPSRLVELHEIIRKYLENADTQLAAFYQSLPHVDNEHQVVRQSLDAFTERMAQSGFSPQPSEAEEQDFLMAAKNFADNFLAGIQQLPDAPGELQQLASQLRAGIEEAETLSYEVPPDQEIDLNQLLELCPRAFYIKDADVQLLPDLIPISELEAGAAQASIYQFLLRIANISVANLRDTDTTRRERKFRNGATRANKFLERWTQEKLEAEFVVDQDKLLFHITGKEGHYGKLSDRSEGFRWFLSFCLSYGLPINSTHGSTLLLDEPGLHLHASAQKDLLELFESVAERCQIVYTTHSPFMINKNFPERIRGVFKKESPQGTTVDNKPYRPTKGGYYEPIRTSIGITLGNSLFIGGNNLIVEGIADQVILTAFSRHLAKQDKQPFISLQDVCITPAGGADNVPYFAYLCSIEDMKTVVLLDNDREGGIAFSRIQSEQVFSQEKVVRVGDAVTKSKETVIELEDLIDREFYHTAFLEAYKELPDIKFWNDLPKTYGEMTKQPAASTKREAEKETLDEPSNINRTGKPANPKGDAETQTVKSQPESKGVTTLYSELFQKHKDKRWGHFDKVMVARRISYKLEDGDIPDDKDKTLSNFKNLFKIINAKFKK